MPIELRIGQNHDGQSREVFEGLDAVLENIKLDRFAQVRLTDGRFVSGCVGPVRRETLVELGLAVGDLDSYLARRIDTPDYEHNRLVRTVEVIDWNQVAWVYQPMHGSQNHTPETHLKSS